MIDYERIIKDCFWDYNFSVDVIKKLDSGYNQIIQEIEDSI